MRFRVMLHDCVVSQRTSVFFEVYALHVGQSYSSTDFVFSSRRV